jgi:hypothetical protein
LDVTGSGEGDPAGAGLTAPGFKAGFNEYLLGGVILLGAAIALIALFFFLAPADYLQIPELQPAVRVTSEASLPIGGSRLINWGPRVILVVRTDTSEYAALQGTSPIDGCTLRWDAPSLRVVSPCEYVVYNLHGNVVRGLTTVPLERYAVFVRQGSIFVTRP